MALREVSYYEVKCDDCEVDTGHLSGPYSAWAAPDQALDDWECDYGYVDGETTLCSECRPRCPWCGYEQDRDFEACCDEAEAYLGGEVNA